jgi:hypothetical protein
MGENLPFAGADGLGVDRHHDALAAEPVGGAGHNIGVGHRRRVEADLVGACQQERAHILGRAHPAAHGERDKALFGGAAHHVEHGAAVLMRGVNVEETQLIRARRIIGAGGIDRIARVTQVDEIDALDHAAIGHVETGNDTGLEHIVAVTGISRRCLWAFRPGCQRM